jgi:hypothetical protein
MKLIWSLKKLRMLTLKQSDHCHKLPDLVVVLCIVSGVDKLYGVIPWKSNYCFICTWYYSNTIRWTGKRYFKDKIYIGGKDKILILNTDGSRVREITTDGGVNYNVLYNERNDQLLLREESLIY